MVALLVLTALATLACAPAPVAAEVQPTVSIRALNTLIFGGVAGTGGNPASAGTAEAELDLRSRGNSDVRSHFQLRTVLIEDPEGSAVTEVSVPRAEIRWRADVGKGYRPRFTVGRSRLTWGDGALYNAGDVLNGARPTALDFTEDQLRDETKWLIAAYFPVGRFSFVEPVVLLPMVQETGAGESFATTAPDAQETAAGLRVQAPVAEVKTELGYLYRGDAARHYPYLSLQGNLGVDWYGSVVVVLQQNESAYPTVSGGLFSTLDSGRSGAWTARLETLWSAGEQSWRVYPELTWAPSQLFSTFLRTEATVLDRARWTDRHRPDLLTALGLQWTPSTGLSVSLYGTADMERELQAVTLGVTYVF